MDDYWFKQTVDKPLFGDLLWSRPENKSLAGKLLIVGGSTNGFAHTVDCYNESSKAGAGTVRVLIPESTKKLIGNWSEDIIYGAATSSGGFAQAALAEISEASEWSDCVLIAGELGNNSETTILFEKFLDKYKGLLIIDGEASGFMHSFNETLIKNPSAVFALDLAQLQKLSSAFGLSKPITSGESLVGLVEILREVTKLHPLNLVVNYDGIIIVASQGLISTTKLDDKISLVTKLVVHSVVWYMQNPQKIFEALSCAALTCQK